jgi:hypothetical protein
LLGSAVFSFGQIVLVVPVILRRMLHLPLPHAKTQHQYRVVSDLCYTRLGKESSFCRMHLLLGFAGA